MPVEVICAKCKAFVGTLGDADYEANVRRSRSSLQSVVPGSQGGEPVAESERSSDPRLDDAISAMVAFHEETFESLQICRRKGGSLQDRRWHLNRLETIEECMGLVEALASQAPQNSTPPESA